MPTGVYIRSLKHCENISKGNTGKKFSDERKMNMSNGIRKAFNVPEIREKLHKSKSNGKLGIKWTEERKIKHKEILNRVDVKEKQRLATKVAQNRPEVREKKRFGMKEYLKNNGMKFKISKLQLKFYNILISEGYNPTSEKYISGMFVDIYLFDYNLVIEVYGNYPHANPKIYKADSIIYGRPAKIVWKENKIRIEKIKKLGYKVLIFWEDEICDNLQKCLYKIKDVTNGISISR